MSTYGKPRLRRKAADSRIKALTGLAAATLAIAPVVAAFAQTGGATGVSGDSAAATSTSTAPAQGGATGVSSDDTAASTPTTTNSTSTDQTGVSSTDTTGTTTYGSTTNPNGMGTNTNPNGMTPATTTPDQTGTVDSGTPIGAGTSDQTGATGTMSPGMSMPANGTTDMSPQSGTSSMPGNGATGTMTPGMNNGAGYGTTTYGNGGAMINGTGAMGEVSTTGMNGMSYTGMRHIDFTVLADPRINYFDIRRAHAYGLTNQDIGCAYTLSRLTDRSMTDVLNRVEDGATFPGLAEEWGVPLQDVYKPLWDRDRIHEYMTAYNNTGFGALHKKAWNNWPDWVDWQVTGPAAADAAADNGTGAPGIETPNTIDSQTSISDSTTTTGTTNAAMPGQTITDVIRTDGRFTQLSSALTAAGLDSYLGNNGPFTVFAPTDAAFAKLPQGQLTALMQNPAELSKLLQYHMVGQNLQQSDMSNMTTQALSSIEGSQLNIANSNGTITVNGATVTGTAIPASNGTIYAIDTVLMPPDLTQVSGTDNSAAPANSAVPDTDNGTTTPAPAGTQ